MDITEVIQHQHAQQRQLFAYLEQWPTEDTAGLAAMWRRLEIVLELHADCEERFFYPALATLPQVAVGEGWPPAIVVDAVTDHNGIRAALREVGRHKPGSAKWWTAVHRANAANSRHLAVEEREDLTIFRRHVSLDRRHELAQQFLRFEAQNWARGVSPVDKDPHQVLTG